MENDGKVIALLIDAENVSPKYIKTIIDEVRVSAPFKAAPAWTIMIKYIAPVLVIIILVAYVAAQFGFFSM